MFSSVPENEFGIEFEKFDVNGNRRYSILAGRTNTDSLELARRLPAGRARKNGTVSFQAYAGDPIGTVQAAISGMNIAEWFARRAAMRKHPAGKGI